MTSHFESHQTPQFTPSFHNEHNRFPQRGVTRILVNFPKWFCPEACGKRESPSNFIFRSKTRISQTKTSITPINLGVYIWQEFTHHGPKHHPKMESPKTEVPPLAPCCSATCCYQSRLTLHFHSRPFLSSMMLSKMVRVRVRVINQSKKSAGT